MSLSEKFKKHLAQTSPYPIQLEVKRAKGSWIYSTDKKYLDFTAGIAVNNLGHGHPKLVKAVQEQAAQYMHVMPYGEYIFSPQVALADKLQSLLPKELNSAYLVNSGTEANEAAMKLAKRITGRPNFGACLGSYHGNTQGSLSLSGNENKKYAFRPLIPGVRFLRFGNFQDLDLIDESLAGMIIEPIQGDAGVRIPSKEYLQALREKCSQTGTLLIFDEIQTGMGRTGKLFAFEHYGVVPDILTVGKAFGGGLPLAGMISSEENTRHFTFNPVLGHITTFGGNPVACSAGLAQLEVFEDEGILEQIEEKADLLATLLSEHPKVRDFRHKGFMMAMELKNAEEVQVLVEKTREKGLLVFWFLSSPHCFRIQPPLNLSIEEVKIGASIILEALDELG